MGERRHEGRAGRTGWIRNREPVQHSRVAAVRRQRHGPQRLRSSTVDAELSAIRGTTSPRLQLERLSGYEIETDSYNSAQQGGCS
jgi:hypothetical protein